MMLAGVVFGTHPRNPRNSRKWCHEVRFRCLLPRAPVGQDDGSLSKLPQMIREWPPNVRLLEANGIAPLSGYGVAPNVWLLEANGESQVYGHRGSKFRAP